MARARGANALLAGAFESAYGTSPVSGFNKLPFVTSNLGEERPLLESDLLGLGRQPQDPTPDVATNDGDLVVPVDVRAFGHWLKLFFGSPTTSSVGSNRQHVFASGVPSLPSMSLEIGHPEVPTYGMHFGVRGNQLRIGMARSGHLNATLGLVAQGERDPTASTQAGAPTAIAVDRFAQATGSITNSGTPVADIVAADIIYSNNLDKVETIRADGRIGDADPGMCTATGSITARFGDAALLNAATAGTPVALNFGWTRGAFSLIFATPRVFLPKAKRPITGPGGIQAEFAFQASGALAANLTATLLNDVTTYA